MTQEPRFRIGELSRRVGASPEVLRAWETRYGLLAPERTAGGLRLYTQVDEHRVREMSRQIAAGLSAAEAARVVLGHPLSSVPPEQLLDQIDASLMALDEAAAHAALDQTFAADGLEAALTRVILPFLRSVGDRWAAGQITVAQEHFASALIGGRLRSLARGWGGGRGPRVLLACPEGEEHELGLICFGLLLRERGWSITYFGARTPAAGLATAVAELAAQCVVLSATDAERFRAVARSVRTLGGLTRLAIGGPGASRALARSLGAELLPPDLIAAADALAAAP